MGSDFRRFPLHFLSSLAKAGMASATQNQAFNALLFFYRHVLKVELGKISSLRAAIPEQVRVAPSVDDVRGLLSTVEDFAGYPTKLIVRLLYGCGMRVSEPLNLRLKDVDLSEMRIVIRCAKGAKDRIVPVPCSLATELSAQAKMAAGVWERDAAVGIPVALPGLLAVKYPAYQFAHGWAWLFPSHSTCPDPRTGRIIRWRVHEANVQRAVRAAARGLGLAITPHHLRHAYAPHALKGGASVRDIQDALGHVNLETTAKYLTPSAMSVRSPLDHLSV